jgi:hypothetical protein
MVKFIVKINADKTAADTKELFLRFPSDCKIRSNETTDLYAWGDPIIPEAFRSDPEKVWSPEDVIKNISGHFYYIIRKKGINEIFLGSSLFSILPVFYYQNQSSIYISSSPELIREFAGDIFSFSKSFILEKLLFNHPFADASVYTEIKCLSTNSFLKISKNGVETITHTSIADWFTDSPASGKRVLETLSELFIDHVNRYLPSEPYYLSFTSGFDGRVLLALSTFYEKKFTAFSFGKEWSEDIVIPTEQSGKLNIEYESFLLNDDHYLKEASDCGREFTLLSHGMGNWARAHYMYTTKKIADKSKYLITGNFGSELFRAFHNPGVMVTPFLFDLINTENSGTVLHSIESRPELRYLRLSEFKQELQALSEHINSYFRSKEHLSKNQFLYNYLLEEVFRKYFGAEIIAQSSFLINRTPFLDRIFVMELFKTGYAGVYSDFFEKNPMKRYKGQLLYAYILRSTNETLYNLKTGKGYRPSDLLSPSGRFRIAASYAGKKMNLSKPVDDPFAVQMVYNRNRQDILKMKLNKHYFNDDLWRSEIGTITDFNNTIINYLSLNWLINLKNASV